MRTAEEMREFFRSMPAKRKENPYWVYDEADGVIRDKAKGWVMNRNFILEVMHIVHKFFLRVYESFHTEAQVIVVRQEDKAQFTEIGIPCLADNLMFGTYLCAVMVLPQQNAGGLSRISEAFWQEYIVSRGIVPLARIHSHHVLNAYQSATDYASLNSGTLEMVLGRIDKPEPDLCFWLDIPGTDQKAITYRQTEADPYPVRWGRAKNVGDMVEELKTALFVAGPEEVETVLGFECPDKDKDALDNLLDQVLGQMPEKALMGLYGKYCLSV